MLSWIFSALARFRADDIRSSSSPPSLTPLTNMTSTHTLPR